MSRESMIKTALSFVGTKEGSSAHTALIDTYNRQNPLPRGYKMPYTGKGNDWCAAFITAIAIISGNYDAIHPECGCPEMLKHMRERGMEIDRKNARPGDVLFFCWDKSGEAQHVGFIVEVHSSKAKYTTCEGNISDSVVTRTFDRDDPRIIAVCSPAYDDTPQLLDWQKTAVNWATKKGVSDGKRPNDTATRSELMEMCRRTYVALLKDIIKALGGNE